MEAFECRGKWNLHHSNEKYIEGILKFDPVNGGQLFLRKSVKSKYDIIDGQGDNGTVYTLIGCIHRSTRVLINKDKKTAYHIYDVARIIKDQKLNDIDKIKFSLIRVNFLHLPEWLGMLDPYSLENQTVSPSITSITLYNNTFKLILDSNITRDLGNNDRNIETKKGTWILIEPPQTKSLEECISIIEKVQEFLTFSTSHYNIPLAVKASFKKENLDSDVQIYYKLGYWDSSYFTPTNNIMLLTYNDILESFENLESFFRIWINTEDELHIVFDLYIMNLVNQYISEDLRFLNLVRALESFHRIRFPNDLERNPEDHKKRIDYILSSIGDEKIQRWLERKLKRSNDPNLQARLIKLTKNDKLMKSKLFYDDNTLNFLTEIIPGRRNYLAHLDQNNKYKNLRRDDIVIINGIMRRVLEVLLLRDLHIEEKVIEKVISRNLQAKPIFYSVEKYKEKIDEFLEKL